MPFVLSFGSHMNSTCYTSRFSSGKTVFRFYGFAIRESFFLFGLYLDEVETVLPIEPRFVSSRPFIGGDFSTLVYLRSPKKCVINVVVPSGFLKFGIKIQQRFDYHKDT